MFVILGANGKIGRATIEALRQRGAPVRAVIRNPDHAPELEALGCEIAIAGIENGPALRQAMHGAEAVQVICPVAPQAEDAAAAMEASLASIAAALAEARPASVLAISDYGAQHEAGTGITVIFHHLEMILSKLGLPLTLLRSCEHMQNWTRLLARALETGTLVSLHHPLTKRFPTVSAGDVGRIAAPLLTSGGETALRIVHAEGPERYSAEDVAATLASLSGRPVEAKELPRAHWLPALVQGGLSPSYAELVMETFDAHNAGRIEVEPDAEVRRGETSLRDALAGLMASAARATR